MSLLTWFKAKSNPQVAGATRSAPLSPLTRDAAAIADLSRSGETAAEVAARRKGERARMRELLYNVVRESMVRVGVLSSSFKFKVLATDPKGRKFIVMMDLSLDFGGDISQLAQIETLICQVARARHNIVVSAVYWRAEGASSDAGVGATMIKTNAAAASRNAGAELAAAPVNRPPADSNTRKFEPVLNEEVNALKQALAMGARGNNAAPAQSRSSSNYGMLTGYEKTEIIESEMPEPDAPQTEILDDDARFPALSPTQYGELR